MAMSERDGYRAEAARSFAALGATWDSMARFRLAHHCHRYATVLADEVQHPLTLGLVYFCLGYHEECLGAWDRALPHYRQAADLNRDLGDFRGWGTVTTCLSRIYMQQGNFARSLAESEQLILIGQEGSDPLVWGWGLMRKGDNLMRLGALDDTIAHLQYAVELIQSVLEPYTLAEANSLLARCYVRQGRLTEAIAIAEARARHTDAPRQKSGHKCLAEVYLAIAEQASGTVRDRVMKSARRACQEALKSSAFYLGDEPRAWRLYGTYAWLQGRAETAQKRWRKSLQSAERLGAQWELGMTLLDMGMRLSDADHLQRAETLLTTVCATRDAAQAHQRRDQLATSRQERNDRA
jgi:tetratricopeptide (TPR) repeat protein